jgi:hypothetical protein
VKANVDITEYNMSFIKNLMIPEVCIDKTKKKSKHPTVASAKGKGIAQGSSGPDSNVVVITSPENRKHGILGRLKTSGGAC